jgi:hypothetical protein
MLKRKLKKWLGVSSLESDMTDARFVLHALDDAQDRLANMYESNRIRIDMLQEKVMPVAKKRGRPAKVKTTKKEA